MLRSMRWAGLASVLVTASASAEEGGTIRGTVYVLGNEPLPEAVVEVVGTGRTTTTDLEGRFELRDVPASRQELRISFPGYRDFKKSVRLEAGQELSLEADLQLDERFGEEIVITGSRFGEKRLESPSTVETVQAKTLQQAAGPTFMAALATMKGVDFADNGINEKRISTRGFNTQFNSRMLSMVDGRLAQMPGSSLPLGGQLSTPSLDIKAVEVVIGPASALYGANAHAGVINVLTKSPWDESGASVALRGGTQSLLDGSARVAGTVAKNLGYKFTGQVVSGKDFAPNRELGAHHYGNRQLPLVYEGDLVEDYDVRSLRAEGFLYYKLGDWDFKGGYGVSSHDGAFLSNSGRSYLRDWQFHQQTISATHPNWFAHVTRTNSNAGRSYQLDRLAAVLQSTGGAPSDPSSLEPLKEQLKFIDNSQLIDSELQYRNEFDGLKLITGIQARYYNPSSNGTYLADANGTTLSALGVGGYVQADYSLLRDRLRLVGAARLDTHTDFAPQFSPKAAVVYSPTRNQHLRVGYNQAFKSPTLLENYLLIAGIQLGNREGFLIKDGSGNVLTELRPLVPEQVDSVELGYKASFNDKVVVDVVGYHSWYRNFIGPLTLRANPAAGTYAYLPDGTPTAEGTPTQGTLYTFSNFGRSRVAGVDAGVDYQLAPEVTLNGSVSYIRVLSFRNDDPTQKELLLNVPELKLKSSVTLQNLLVRDSFLRLFGRYQSAYAFRSGRWDSSQFYADGKVPARFVADLSLGYNFSNGLGVSASVLNLLDDKGVDILGAPMGGRFAFVQLSYNYAGLDF